MNAFDAAMVTAHPVESQWHYPILTAHGYLPLTPSQNGLVRGYLYKHPTTGHLMKLVTGASADYWFDEATGAQGYHTTLNAHLQRGNNA